MSEWFWIDVMAYAFSAACAAGLGLLVLATAPRRNLNRLFFLFCLAEVVWAMAAFHLRIALIPEMRLGDAELALRFSTLGFMLMGPPLLMFASRYVNRRVWWRDLAALSALGTTVVIAFPLFFGEWRIIHSPRLLSDHVTPIYEFTPLGYVVFSLSLILFIWAFILFVRYRQQIEEPYLALGVLVLIVGILWGGALQPTYPVMSMTTTASVLILGYGIVSRQLFNPLREQATELERKVRMRTRELEEAATRLALLNEVGSKIAAELDVDGLMDTTVRLLEETFGFHYVSISLVDRSRNALLLKARAGAMADLFARDYQLELTQGMVGWVARSGQRLLAPDVEHDPHYINLEGLPTRSELAVPIRVQGQVVGVLDAQSPQLNAFGENDVMVMETLADQVGVAMENARLYESVERELDERRRADQALRESELRFRSIAETASDAVIIFDVHERILFWNQAAQSIFGYSLGETRDKLLSTFFVKPFYDTLKGEMEQVVSTGRSQIIGQVLEARGLRKDGTEFPVELTLATWQTSQGTFFTIIARDITERERAGESLRRYTAQLEALREVGLELVRQLDLDELLHSIVSRAVDLLHGTAGGFYLYRPARDVIERTLSVGDTATSVESVLKRGEGLAGQAWEKGELVVVEDYEQWEGRDARFDELSVGGVVSVPVWWGDEFLGVFNVSRKEPGMFTKEDIQLLRLFTGQAAIALQNARLFEMERERTSQMAIVSKIAERITSILALDELLDEVVELIVDAFGYYHAAIMLVDAEVDDLVFQVSEGGYVGETPPDFRQRMDEGMIGWVATTGETLLAGDVTQDPRYIPAYLTKTRSELDVPLKYHGEVIGVLDLQSTELHAFSEHDVIGMEMLAGHIAAAIESARLFEQAQHEIAERKRAEQSLKEYSERLEEMVEDRTRELRAAQDQLIEQEKLAVLGKLAGGVGHELRNPLAAIKNAAYFLNLVIKSPEQEVSETLKIIEREVANSERIISSLLDFARPRPPLRRQVDLREVIGGAVTRISAPDTVEMVVDLDNGLPTIQADPDQLCQVFENIIFNGVQAVTSPGVGNRLAVGVAAKRRAAGRVVIKSREAEPGWVAISVSDTGPGMSEENLGRLFEPLFTTKAKGIGLGLAIARTLVEGHGGTIGVTSEKGHGSTFTVRLPMR